MFLSQHRFFFQGDGDGQAFEIQMDPIFFRFSLLQYKQQANFFKSLSRISFHFIAGFVCSLVFCEANIIEFSG